MNNIELNDVGYLMALTGNGDINDYAINRFKDVFGENGSFRLITPEEMRSSDASPHEGLFSPTDDFIRLTEVARAHPTIQEINIESKEAFEKLVKSTRADENIIPIFLKKESGELEILKSNLDEVDVDSFTDTKLVYLGKPFDPEEVSVAKKEVEESDLDS